MIGRITGQKEKIYERGSFGMKQRTKYSKRCLAVLLAILMLLAAAQPVSLVAAAGADPDPSFGEGAVAGARYTTSGTIELSFSEAVSQSGDIAYYVDFYDLDSGYSTRGVPVNENPVRLENVQHAYADTSFVSATISAQVIKSLALDMSHRISAAITAVDREGWRSQPLEALVGDSLSIPANASSPAENAQFVAFENFEGETGSGGKEHEGKTPAAWMYNNTACDEQTGNNNFTPANIDGVLFRDDTAYQTPGFNTSNALRVYMKNSEKSAFTQGSTPSSLNGYQRLDISYTPATRNFVNADELWIWVDTSYVKFDEFALQVRYLDREGDLFLNADLGTDGNSYVRDGEKYISKTYSKDIYSTVGYAAKNNGASVPVYYQNQDGLWDTLYTNKKGYLEDFGHYRGFLRVPINKLWNETENSSYNQLTEERIYSYNIKIYDGWLNWGQPRGVIKEFTAQEAYDNPNNTFSWVDWRAGNDPTMYFDKDTFARNYAPGLTVNPLEEIASVGITWKGASEDSINKSFYIDQIGFSGANMAGGTPVTGLTTSNADAVQALVEQYLPSDSALINVSHAGIISDLRTICRQFGIDNAQLTAAEAALENILQGSKSPVDWLSAQLDKWVEADTYTDAQIENIESYFNLYQTLTLGDLYRLGLKNEAKLIRIYNIVGLNEWYPDELGKLYFKPFNDVESNYEIGQTALHEYDDYRLLPNSQDYYFDRAHNILWNDSYKGAWENSKNLVAYSRSSYDAAQTGTNSEDQRFGLASTSVGQNGFANSRSIDTSFYRDVLSNSETYRISLTHNGENTENWDQLSGVNIGNASDFIFYADFSDMNDIRKLWIALRTADGSIYSHDEDDGTRWDYQILNMDAAKPEWQTVQTDNDGNDGCLTGEFLNGFRGFIKIPLAHFRGVTSSGDPGAAIPSDSVVKQIKLFYTGVQGGESPAGALVSLDMLGFVSANSFSGSTQMKDLAASIKEPSYDQSGSTVQQLIDGLYTDVILLDHSETKVDYLFDYNADAYQLMLTAYRTLTAAEKDALGQVYQTKLADMAAFVRNYEKYNNVDGNLSQYVVNSQKQFTAVVEGFGKNAVATAQIVAVLKEYDGYPAKYQNAVLTYWADRNLSAVFPNFTVQTDQITTNTSADDPLITMQINAEGTAYSGSAALPFYAAAAADPYNVELDIPSTVELSMGDTKITVPINGRKLNPTDPGTMNFELSIAESSVEKSGVYTGSFNVTLKTPVADKGTNQGSNTISGGVPNAESYRMETYTVYVQLVCDASYTVVIPADVGVGWGRTDRVEAGSLKVENLFIPTTASVEVGVTSENEFKMIHNSFALPYRYQTGDLKDFRGDTFNMSTTDLERELYVEVPNWSGAPSDQYKDTLTFTVTYHEP